MNMTGREYGNQSGQALSIEDEDCLVDSAIAGLRSALDERPTRRLVLACDPTLADPLRPQIAALGLSACQVPISKSLNLPRPPYLVEVDDEARREQFVNASLRAAVQEATRPAPATRRARSVCAWLLTSESLGAIAHGFNQRIRIRDEAGKARTLRFWDPRVTQHIADLFSGRTAQSWLPQADWGYIDASARWTLLPAGEWPDNRPPQPAWPVLQRLSLINEVHQQLTKDGRWYPQETLNTIKSALGVAAKVGLTKPEDQVHFALHRVRLEAAIEHAPLIREAIDEVASLGGSFHKIIHTFDDTDWAAIAQSAAVTQDKEPSHEA